MNTATATATAAAAAATTNTTTTTNYNIHIWSYSIMLEHITYAVTLWLGSPPRNNYQNSWFLEARLLDVRQERADRLLREVVL